MAVEQQSTRMRPFLKGLLLILTVMVAVVLLRRSGVGEALQDHSAVRARLERLGFCAPVVFVLAAAALTSAGFPKQLLCLLAGYAFGFVGGTVMAVLGATFGSALAFAYARALGRDWVRARLRGGLRRLDELLQRNPFAVTLTVRLFPVGSNLLTNLAAGVSSCAVLPFLAGTALGTIPQSAVFCLLGSGVHSAMPARFAASLALFALSALLALWLMRRNADLLRAGASGAGTERNGAGV